MKLNSLAVLSIVGLMSIATGCKYTQAELDNAVLNAYNDGYDDGYVDGDAAGYERARVYFASADYNAGFTDGSASGYTTGFNAGSASGYTTGYNNGYSDGYTDGDSNGYTDGYNDGYDDGSFDGYNLGYDDGYVDGYDGGYDDGFTDGYDIGYDDGWDDALGFSVEALATNTKNAKVNLLSKVSNSLVDISKIKAPTITSRGVEANGSLIFEETSMVSHDLEKRAGAVENYLNTQLAKQINTNYGIAQERSLQLAKLSTHLRKLTTTRALTNDDADAFTEEFSGSNLKDIESAVKSSNQGNAAELNSIVEKAALQNKTSPEQISLMMNQLFF